MPNLPQQATFKKDLRMQDIWALALGAIIGWGCFVLPGTLFLPIAGPSTIFGLLLSGLAMTVIAFSYGYCIKKYPLSGGEFVYTDASFGKKHAFACGWMIILGYWSLIPLNSTAIGIITRYLMPGIFQFGYLYTIAGWEVYLGEVLLSSAFIIILGYMNVKGVKSSGWFQTTTAVALTASVAFCLIGVLMEKPDISGNLQPFFAEIINGELREKAPISCIIAVACYAPYCFVGFDCIPQAAEEYSFSHKAALSLMIGAILAGTLIYAILVFCTAVIAPWGPMMASNPVWATGQSVRATLGDTGLLFLGIGMLCAVLSGMNAFYLAASRLLYSMALAEALPPAFGKLHPRYNTPAKATCFLLLFSLASPWFGHQLLYWMIDVTCVGAAIGFTYTCASAAVIAAKEHHYSQTTISIIGTVLAAIFIILPFLPGTPGFSPPAFVILLIWIVLGFIFWFRIRKNFLYGLWHGISVEQILKQKTTPADSVESSVLSKETDS